MKYYTSTEAAEYLGVHKHTLYSWHLKKKLVPDKLIGKIRLYTQAQLDTKFCVSCGSPVIHDRTGTSTRCNNLKCNDHD